MPSLARKGGHFFSGVWFTPEVPKHSVFTTRALWFMRRSMIWLLTKDLGKDG